MNKNVNVIKPDNDEGVQFSHNPITEDKKVEDDAISFKTLRSDFPDKDEWMSENVDLGSKVPKENVDDLLTMCGDEGVWQVLIFLLTSLCGFNTSIQGFIYTFIGDVPEHNCALPNVADDDYSEDDLKALLIPKDENGGYQKCFQYPFSFDKSSGRLIVDRSHLVKCNGTEYKLDIFTNTIVTEWNLVCDDAFWISTVQAAYMFGMLIGSVFFGWLSDKIGRRQTIWISSFMFFISSPVVALAPNFSTLVIFRFILGITAPGIYSACYVLAIEVVGSKRRGLVGGLFCIPFSVGYMVLPIIAYFIRDWRHLQLTCSCLSVLLLISWWHLPESPRWLLIKGRAKEAELVFRQIAKTNGKLGDLPKNFSDLVEKVAFSTKEDNVEKTCMQKLGDCTGGILSLLRTPKIRLRTLILAVAFTAISMVYYGIALNASNLGIDKYLFTFLCGLFEIPSDVMIPSMIGRLGRRVIFSGMLLLCGIFLLLSLLVSNGSILAIILAVLALITIAADSALIYLYSSELFPTTLRTYGLGFAAMLGRTGGIASPYIVEVVGESNKTYPTIIFGGVSLMAGVLTLLLPETKNKKLPETVEEVESS